MPTVSANMRREGEDWIITLTDPEGNVTRHPYATEAEARAVMEDAYKNAKEMEFIGKVESVEWKETGGKGDD